MATIIPNPSSYQTPQAPAQQVSQPQTQDPLFEALAKYITSGPGPSSASNEQIQEILSAQTALPGGKEYLDYLASPSGIDPSLPQSPIHRFDHHAAVLGSLSTSTTLFQLNFDSPGANIKFSGSGNGIFFRQNLMLSNGIFFWNGAESPSGSHTFEVVHYRQVVSAHAGVISTTSFVGYGLLTTLQNSLHVTFKDNVGTIVAQLQVNDAGVHVGPAPIPGTGTFGEWKK